MESLAGTQLDSVPLKSLRSIADFEAVLGGVTALDVQEVVGVLDFSEANITSCVGVASPKRPQQ